MSDVSETGARIDVENAEQIPDQFVLLLSNRGTPKRNCHVVWRNGHQIGVEFERRRAAPKPFRRKSAKAPPAVTDAQPAVAAEVEAEPA